MGLAKEMKSVALFFVYALALINVFVWMVLPEFFFAMQWKLDIFWTLLFAPLIYQAHRDEPA